jgi:DNA-binding XRE family transcriptional regulator
MSINERATAGLRLICRSIAVVVRATVADIFHLEGIC